MSDSQFIPATIRTGGEDVAVAFEPAQVRSLSPGQGAEWEVMVLMHVEGVTLDVLEHMHLRFNGEPTLRPAMHGTEMDDESGHTFGFGFGISGDGLVESIESVWVEDGEQSLGMLPIRLVGWDSVPTGSKQRVDSDGRDRVPTYAPTFGLSVRAHRIALIVATASGSIGAAFLGYQLTRSFWGVIGAAFGGALMEELFHRLIPAICPECGHRAECQLSTRDYSDHGEQRSSKVIRYECRACGYELPRRVKTKADVAEVADYGVRFANFVKAFFTFVGSLFVLIAAIIAVLGAIRGELQTAALGVGVMIFGTGITLLARKLVGGFADKIRQMTPQLAKHFVSDPSFTSRDQPERASVRLEPVPDTMEGPVAHVSVGYVERSVLNVPLHTEPQTGGLVR